MHRHKTITMHPSHKQAPLPLPPQKKNKSKSVNFNRVYHQAKLKGQSLKCPPYTVFLTYTNYYTDSNNSSCKVKITCRIQTNSKSAKESSNSPTKNQPTKKVCQQRHIFQCCMGQMLIPLWLKFAMFSVLESRGKLEIPTNNSDLTTIPLMSASLKLHQRQP